MSEKGPPKPVPVTEYSPEIRKAGYEMIAELLRQEAGVLNLTFHDVTYEGRPIGAFEISIRKID